MPKALSSFLAVYRPESTVRSQKTAGPSSRSSRRSLTASSGPQQPGSATIVSLVFSSVLLVQLFQFSMYYFFQDVAIFGHQVSFQPWGDRDGDEKEMGSERRGGEEGGKGEAKKACVRARVRVRVRVICMVRVK